MERKPNKSNVIRLRNQKLLALVASGKSVADAASELNLTRCHASGIVNRSDAGFELQANLAAEINSIMEQRLPQLVTEALAFLGQQVVGGTTKDKFRATQLIILLTRHASSSTLTNSETGEIIEHITDN
jgi:hypothetical protein